MFNNDADRKAAIKKLSVLEEYAGSYGLELSERKREQLLLYYEMLIEKNKVMNLTAITEFNGVLFRHFLDSVFVCKAVEMQNVTTMIDVGTGAGFPGIPVKIVFPHLKTVLLDSLNKRVSFLNEVIEKLNLAGTEAVHSRAEDAGRDKSFREQYDLCTSRAVSRLSTLSEYCLPFVKKGGCFVSWKSDKSNEEIQEAEKAIYLLGGKIGKCTDYHFSDSKEDFYRTLVVIGKEKATPQKYPRKAGLPQKEPL